MCCWGVPRIPELHWDEEMAATHRLTESLACCISCWKQETPIVRAKARRLTSLNESDDVTQQANHCSFSVRFNEVDSIPRVVYKYGRQDERWHDIHMPGLLRLIRCTLYWVSVSRIMGQTSYTNCNIKSPLCSFYFEYPHKIPATRRNWHGEQVSQAWYSDWL